MGWDEYKAGLEKKRDEYRVNTCFKVCDDLSYTLQRLGYINRIIRATWAQELFILMIWGSKALEEHYKV